MREKFIIGILTRGIVSMFIITITLGISLNFAIADEWYITPIVETTERITTPVIAVDENIVIHVVWKSRSSNSDNYNVYYANSKDNWLPIKITDTANRETPSIFIDKTKSVYIAWVDRRNGPNGDGSGWDVYYATSLDGWVNHLITAGPTVACFYPSIAVDDARDIHLTFIRYTTSGGWPYNPQLFYTNKNSGWSEERVSFTGHSRIGSSDMDIGDNGVVHVVFSNILNGQTRHIWYANSASNWINVQIDSDATANWWDDRFAPIIDVDSKNTAHVVWHDMRNTALPGDPAYHGGIGNRVELYYANSGSAWANVEIALPIDTTGPRIKVEPSIFVQNSLVHVTWIQFETDDLWSQPNLFYGNSINWNNAVNLSNHTESLICVGDPGDEDYYCYPPYGVSSSSNSLSVDKNGISHVSWEERDNINHISKIFYASNTQPGVEVQNDRVTFDPDPSTYTFTPDTAGCQTGAVGKFSFDATLTNISEKELSNLFVEVDELTNDNLLLTNNELICEGERFEVQKIDDYDDGYLNSEEYVDVPFTVCLKKRKPFRFFVDVYGSIE